MRRRVVLGGVVAMIVACTTPEPRPPGPPPSMCGAGQVPDPVTHTCITACGAQPDYPRMPIDPTCSTVTLKDGQSWHDQLTVQLSSGATTRVDCPRMRFRGQDTPVCVVGSVGGRVRGACCPPGHSNPSDPECVEEGSVDEMFRRQRVWEWCSTDKPLTRPCEPCVWVSGARR